MIRCGDEERGCSADSDRSVVVAECYGETAEQPGGDVRSTETDQFAIGIDPIAVLRAKAARRYDATAEADDGAAIL